MAHSNYNGIILYSANYHYDNDTIDAEFIKMKNELASSALSHDINNIILLTKKRKEIITPNESGLINNLFLEDSNIKEIYNLIAQKEIEKQLRDQFIKKDIVLLNPINIDVDTVTNTFNYKKYPNVFIKSKKIEDKQEKIKKNIEQYINDLQKKINNGDIINIEKIIDQFDIQLNLILNNIDKYYKNYIYDDYNYEKFIDEFNKNFLYNTNFDTEKTQAILNVIMKNIESPVYDILYRTRNLKDPIKNLIFSAVFNPQIKKYEQQKREILINIDILNKIIINYKDINKLSLKIESNYDNIDDFFNKLKKNCKIYYEEIYNTLLNEIDFSNNEIINEIKTYLHNLFSESINDIDILFDDFLKETNKILKQYLDENLTDKNINIKMKALINDQIEKLKSEILRDDYIKKNISSEIMKSISSLNIALEAKAAKENIEKQIFDVLQFLKSSEKSKSQVLDAYDKDLFVKLILNLLKFKINLNAVVNQLINLLINHLFEKKIWEQIKNIFNDRYNEYKFTLTSKKIDNDKEILKELVKSIKTLNKKIEFAIPIFIYYKDGIVFDSYQILNENIKTITLKTLIDNYKY